MLESAPPPVSTAVNKRESAAPRKFELSWLFIAGAVFTLIGVYFLLFDKKVNGVIVGYVGLMTLIFAAAIILIQHIRRTEQEGTEAAEHRAEIESAIQNGVVVACCFVGIVVTGLTIVCAATVTVFKGGTTTGLLWALGTLFSGGFIGLLFAIPGENEPQDSNLHINTSLNQVADWLTKIIVGVSLVNAKDAYNFFLDAVRALGAGLATEQQSAAKAFAGGLIITFLFLGFTGTYLLARAWLTLAIVRADQLALTLAHEAEAARGVPFARQTNTIAPPESEQAKQIVALVEKAAALIDSKGSSVFPEFGKGEWLTGDTYVFVDDLKGVVLFNGGFPEREGSNSSNLKDSNGKLFWAEFLKVIQSKGSGWVDYMFPKPGQTQASQKWSYVKAVNIDGTPGFVGAGFYPQ
jgi:cytochrome c